MKSFNFMGLVWSILALVFYLGGEVNFPTILLMLVLFMSVTWRYDVVMNSFSVHKFIKEKTK